MPTNLFSGIGSEFPPIRTDMWSIIFPEEMGISERFQVSASRPQIANSKKTIKYKSSNTFYKGSSQFQEMTIVFRDVVGPSVMQKLWLWQKEHYDPDTGCGGYPSVYMKDLILYLEDDCGNPVQKWILYGAFIINLDGGALNMEADAEIATVTLQIAYQKASLIF